jgi:putative addiction module CopG family antidote
MNVHLSEELEQFVDHAVRAGRYASKGDVVRDALIKLQQTMPASPAEVEKRGKPKRSARSVERVRSEMDARQYMLDIGLMSELPNTAADFDDPKDQLTTIKGEPLSETIIRERR